MLSERNKLSLAAMKLVEILSTRLNTISYIWGGFTIDIYQGRVLREHHDLDYLTRDLNMLRPRFTKLFDAQGWHTENLDNGDLRATKDDIKIHLGNIQLTEKAKWTHNGEKGYICFPPNWLNPEPMPFYDINVHIVEPEFEYVVKENPQILNPDWKPRDKDIIARRYLKEILEKRGVDLDTLHSSVTSHVFA